MTEKNTSISNQESIKSIPMTVGNSRVLVYLANEMYKNKILIPIQEILSNAADIHLKVGQKKAIDVHLPTPMELYFSVKDSGTGIAPERMYLYGSYGVSDNEGNNESKGNFGLGSKSPFAYTDSYVVMSTYNGILYIYNFSLSKENGNYSLSMNLEGEVETSEPNGLEIRIPVNPKDITKFQDYYYRTTFFWGDQKPNIINIEDVPENNEYKLLSENIVKIDDKLSMVHADYFPKTIGGVDYSQTIFFVIDGIPYKCPHEYASKSSFLISTKWIKFYTIPNKTLDISTDRENIVINDENAEVASNYVLEIAASIRLYIESLRNNLLKTGEVNDIFPYCRNMEKLLTTYDSHFKDDLYKLEKYNDTFPISFNYRSDSLYITQLGKMAVSYKTIQKSRYRPYSYNYISHSSKTTKSYGYNMLIDDAPEYSDRKRSILLKYYMEHNDTGSYGLALISTTHEYSDYHALNKVGDNFNENKLIPITPEFKKVIAEFAELFNIKKLSEIVIPKEEKEEKGIKDKNVVGGFGLGYFAFNDKYTDTTAYYRKQFVSAMDFSEEGLDLTNTVYLDVCPIGTHRMGGRNDTYKDNIGNLYVNLLQKLGYKVIGLTIPQRKYLFANFGPIPTIDEFMMSKEFKDLLKMEYFDELEVYAYAHYQYAKDQENPIGSIYTLGNMLERLKKEEAFKTISNPSFMEAVETIDWAFKMYTRQGLPSFRYYKEEHKKIMEEVLFPCLDIAKVVPVSKIQDAVKLMDEHYSFLKLIQYSTDAKTLGQLYKLI